jgi:hypothetical protein
LLILDAFSDDSDDEQAYSSSDEEGEVYIRGKMGKKRKVAAPRSRTCFKSFVFRGKNSPQGNSTGSSTRNACAKSKND